MNPDTNPVCYFALRIISDLMSLLWLEMRYTLEAILTRFTEFRLHGLAVFAVWDLLARPQQMRHINLRRQSPWWATCRWRLIRWEFDAHDSAFRRKKLYEAI
jgi:hypothetical protein